MTREIQLTHDKAALVDDKDFDRVNQFKWNADHHYMSLWYARTKVNGKKISMHRFILDLGNLDKIGIDHINGNGLDNRRANLRLATSAENQRNRGKQKNNTAGFKGVTWKKAAKKYCARIAINGKDKHIGYFESKEDAARAYDKAALREFGEFAKTNF